MKDLYSWFSLLICTALQEVAGQLSRDGVHLMVPPSCPENITTTTQTGDQLYMGRVSSVDIFMNTLGFIHDNTPFDEFYYNVSGLYLMSEPVPSSGRVNNVRAFGYLRPQDLAKLVNANAERGTTMMGGTVIFSLVPFVYAFVYRPDLQDSYTLLHGSEIVTHDLSLGATSELNWPVEKGDRIGILIPEMCDESKVPTLCPAQVNLRVPANECLSALYYNNPSDDIEDLRNIEMDLFEEVLVGLNVDAAITLGMNEGVDFTSDSSRRVLAGLLPCAVLILLLVTAVTCIVIIWRKKKASRSNQKEDDSDSNEYHVYDEPVPRDVGDTHFVTSPLCPGGNRNTAPDVVNGNIAYNAVEKEDKGHSMMMYATIESLNEGDIAACNNLNNLTITENSAYNTNSDDLITASYDVGDDSDCSTTVNAAYNAPESHLTTTANAAYDALKSRADSDLIVLTNAAYRL